MTALVFLLALLSLVFMIDHYEYLQKRSREGVSKREQRVFSNYRFGFTLWLMVMQGISLFLASVHPAVIFIILYFYVNILNLAPQLLHQFYPNLNLR
jgi:hypothetical protein